MELRYLRSDEELNLEERIICTIGVFDGIHIAHKVIFEEVLNEAKNNHMKSAIFTFDPHPDYVLSKRVNTGYVLSIEERIKAFEDYGFDYCFILNTDISLLSLSYLEFNCRFLSSIDTVVIGEDFTYGTNAKGNKDTLRLVARDVKVIKEIKDDKEKIGSSGIRKSLLEGNIEKVNKLLGEKFNIKGKVIKGNAIGRTIGFRTANLNMKEDQQLLKNGVYSVSVLVNSNVYKGVCNIGYNPTVTNNKNKHLEVHILDFNQDLYDSEITVYFERFIREEKKFSNIEELKKQIQEDIKEVGKI